MDVITIDLHFQEVPGIIAAYLIPHQDGALLIESGPGSTLPALQAGLASHGFSTRDITDLFVTHIHLDHAGAAGWLANQGVTVHVHPRGLPHLADPSRLLASAGQIYRDRMDMLWGEMLPVPQEKLVSTADEEVLKVGGLSIRALDTPGHASHHLAYLIGGICFSGDVGGIRLEGPPHIVLPMPPPEFHREMWSESCDKLAGVDFDRIAPTHFGIYEDGQSHLLMLRETLLDTEEWLVHTMPVDDEQKLETLVVDWMGQRAKSHGLSQEEHQKYEIANPSHTSAWGITRYWNKYRSGSLS